MDSTPREQLEPPNGAAAVEGLPSRKSRPRGTRGRSAAVAPVDGAAEALAAPLPSHEVGAGAPDPEPELADAVPWPVSRDSAQNTDALGPGG